MEYATSSKPSNYQKEIGKRGNKILDESKYKLSSLERQLAILMVECDLDKDWIREYQFSNRRWRLDFANPTLKIAIECNGLSWDGKARHQTFLGAADDYKKMTAATLEGWLVVTFSQRDFKNPMYVTETIKDLVKLRQLQ